MTALEIVVVLLNGLGFVALYVIVGFGPGFIMGMLLANRIFAKGQPTHLETHQQAIKHAAQHNAQWAPSNERWQK